MTHTMPLLDMQRAQGAVIQDDTLLHYGDPQAEYTAAHTHAILLDRSAEGRLMLADTDRLDIVDRISTNAVKDLAPGEGGATVFTTPVARIIDRVILHNIDDNRTLLRTSPGRGTQIEGYLRRNIFFRDNMKISDASASLTQLAMYGPGAAGILEALLPGAADLPLHGIAAAEFNGQTLFVLALDPLTVPGFGLVVNSEAAAELWQALLAADENLKPAGTQTYDLLRIEAVRPGNSELNGDYIPLEAGLWPDVSFSKGCYTGQEIIARMESRGKLAKTLVGVTLASPVPPGSTWTHDGRKQGSLTSLAQKPDGTWIGLGFVKPGTAAAGTRLAFEAGETGEVGPTAEITTVPAQ